MAYEREFSILPLSDESRSLVGWLSADRLKEAQGKGEVDEQSTLAELDARGSSSVSKFAKSKTYRGQSLAAFGVRACESSWLTRPPSLPVLHHPIQRLLN